MRGNNFQVHIVIQRTNGLQSGNYIKFFDYSIDTCKLSNNSANFGINLFLRQSQKVSNFKIKCPYKKVKIFFSFLRNISITRCCALQGLYLVNGFEISNSFLPAFIVSSQRFIFTLEFRTKLTKHSKYISIYNLKSTGKLME